MNKSLIDTVIYHANCADGTTSAMIAYRWFKETHPDKSVEYLPYNYSQKPPSLVGKYVLIVDFSFPQQDMEKIIEQTEGNVLVLDHHATAQTNLASIDDKYKVFDMTLCGASLTWNYFYPSITRPIFIDYIEARDLWKKDSPLNWKAFSTALFNLMSSITSTNQLEEYNSLLTRFENDPSRYDDFVNQGSALLDYQKIILRDLAKTATFSIETDVLDPSRKMVFANVYSSILQSELGEYLYDSYPWLDFAVVYNHNHFVNETKLSLRSKKYPVNKLMEKLKLGGGHPNASGGCIKNAFVNGLASYPVDLLVQRITHGKKTLLSRSHESFDWLQSTFPSLVEVGHEIYMSNKEIEDASSYTILEESQKGRYCSDP